MKNKKEYAIGIDLGGTKISGIILDNKGEKLSPKFSILTEADKGQERILDNLKKTISALLAKNKNIIGIGVGSPGPLNSKTGVIISPPNLPFRNFPLKKYLKDEFNLPVVIDNDANAAGIGEAWLGAAKKYKNFVLLTLGTGVGGAIIINGKIYRGTTGNAGEIGHSRVSNSKFRCTCGKIGCLESVCGGRSIKIHYHHNLEEILIKENVQTKQIIKNYQNALFEVVENLRKIIDPEVIVFSGSITGSWNKLIEPVKFTLPVKKSILQNDAGLFGAAKLVFAEIKI